MKKRIALCMIATCGVLLVGCSSSKTPNVEVVRDGSVTETSESTTPIEETPESTEQADEVEEPTEVETEQVVAEEPTESTEAPQAQLDPDADRLDADGTGDIYVVTGESNKFVNNDEFISAVPADVVSRFNSSVHDDILTEYPDLTFVAYTEDTGSIFAKSEEYYFEFRPSAEGYMTTAGLKEYANWWNYD